MDIGVSNNICTPKSSILIGFSIINHPFWGAPIFGNTHMYMLHIYMCDRLDFSWLLNDDGWIQGVRSLATVLDTMEVWGIVHMHIYNKNIYIDIMYVYI